MKAHSPILILTLFLFACGTVKKVAKTPAPTADIIEDNAAVKQKRIKEGTDFAATGNEPFWSLDIDFDGSMHYITAEGYELTVPTGKGENAMDANVTRFQSATDRGSLTVQIFRQECVDNMSGKKNSFRVQVEVKKRGDSIAETVSGCGNYIGLYELNDIWALESIGNKMIDPLDESANRPTMDLRLNEGKVAGLGGCNRYSGSLTVTQDTLKFGYMISTMMACPGMELESRFLKVLNEKALPYKLEKGVLYIGKGDQLLTFKRAPQNVHVKSPPSSSR